MSLSPSLKASNFDSNEDLLNLITSSWDDDRRATLQNSKWTRDYLSRLTSLSLNELIKEPTELRIEQEKTKQNAQMLAYRDYPVFIHAQECRLELDETLQGLDGHLDTFVSAIPDLQSACKVFTQQAQAIVEDRAKITRVLEHQNVLVDLLEIPQLMDTCVWNGYYSEAMDLASHVRLLLVQYPLPVIESIQQQVQASCDSMLVQLVSHLRRPIKLAAAMSVIGHLRRMEAFQSETELRMVFLRSRHEFLEQRIDVMREQMFEIAKQYMSVFPGQESMLLVSDYMIYLITQMRDMLKEEIQFIKDTSSLASLLTQLQYCGVSLGRIGLDFRHLFVNAFEDAMLPLIQEWISEAAADCLKEIKSATDNNSPPSSWMSVNLTSSQHWQDNTQKRHVHQPPMLLVDYPILAVFTNNILSTFNALRLLPAVSLFKPIQNDLNGCFLDIGKALQQYSDQAVLRVPEENVFLQSFCSAYVRWCVPFLQGCLRDGIYADFVENVPLDNADLENLLAAYLLNQKTKMRTQRKNLQTK
ncbi:Dor1-like family-domain-containing protein [Phycomyces nitens]|nr:Dor1-like family-domain-containing protein [Phycomyces nitens]